MKILIQLLAARSLFLLVRFRPPTTAWRKPAPILGCRYRFNGATIAASSVLDEINNSKVCTMGGNPINCTISSSGQYIQAYFNEGSVTGDIMLQFTIGDVFLLFLYYRRIQSSTSTEIKSKYSPYSFNI